MYKAHSLVSLYEPRERGGGAGEGSQFLPQALRSTGIASGVPETKGIVQVARLLVKFRPPVKLSDTPPQDQ